MSGVEEILVFIALPSFAFLCGFFLGRIAP